MIISIAQTKPVTGDVNKNIDIHKKFSDVAVFYGADVIIFPELSLTGYEPTLAKELATDVDDARFNQLQEMSDSKTIVIGAGMPIRSDDRILIGMIAFQPHQPRQVYFKQHLHPDEEPYFSKGNYHPVLADKKIAFAICFEISVPGHAEKAYKDGAEFYIASVAKTSHGIEKAIETLSENAQEYSMTVLLSNCVGECEGKEAGGRSSVWDSKGTLLAQLNDRDEGVIIFDSDTLKAIEQHEEFSFKRT